MGLCGTRRAPAPPELPRAAPIYSYSTASRDPSRQPARPLAPQMLPSLSVRSPYHSLRGRHSQPAQSATLPACCGPPRHMLPHELECARARQGRLGTRRGASPSPTGHLGRGSWCSLLVRSERARTQVSLRGSGSGVVGAVCCEAYSDPGSRRSCLPGRQAWAAVARSAGGS